MKPLGKYNCHLQHRHSIHPCFRFTLPALILLTLSAHISAKAEPLITFEFSGKPGPNTVEQWKKDWPGCLYEDGLAEGRGELINDESKSWLRVLYPKGSYGSNEGGAGWRFDFGRREIAELRYEVRFGDNFDFVKGGKLPGLCGGPETVTGDDEVNGVDGFSDRIMWRKDGCGQAYVYHMHQPSKYGDEFDFPEEFRFVPGVPTEIRLQVKMNRAGKRNGHLHIWANDKLVVERTNLQWRKSSTYGVDSVLFNTFHGGGDSSWVPKKRCGLNLVASRFA